MKYIFIVFSIFFISTSYGQKLTKQQQLDFANDLIFKKHQPADLIKDVEFIHQKLKANHPNLYWYISKKELDKKFDSLKISFNRSLTSMQFRGKLMSVLSVIGDGHILVVRNLSELDSIKGEEKNNINNSLITLLPITIKVIDDKLYLVSNNSNDTTIKVGSEILSINNISSFLIIKKLTDSYIASDGYNKTFKTEFLNSTKGTLDEAYYNDYPITDSLVLLLNHKGLIKKYTVSKKAISIDTIEFKRNNFTDQTTFEYNGPSGNLAKLIVGQFARGDNQFYDTFFSEIKKSKINTLIIDLRNNPGGDVERVKKLFSFLISKPTPFLEKDGKGYISKDFKNFLARNQITEAKYKNDFEPVKPNDSLNFKGKIYVLINGGSFSGASILPANLKAFKNVTFVGSETGGGQNGCTAYIYDYLTLPTSKLSLRYGLIAIKNPIQSKTKGRGVMPDIEIKYTLQDYLNKKDLEMDWVLKDIKKNK